MDRKKKKISVSESRPLTIKEMKKVWNEPMPKDKKTTKIKVLGNDYKCECGFQFSKPGDFRNSDAFITKEGKSGVVCPKCGRKYLSKL